MDDLKYCLRDELQLKVLLCLFCFAVPNLAIAADALTTLQPLVRTYCTRCHGSKVQKGDVRLDQLSDLDPNTFQVIYEQLASGQMPPDDQKQPSAAHRDALMKRSLELARQSTTIKSSGFRRLNKREYANTVRDLLGLREGVFDPGERIYDDEIDEGFDTNADSLVISNELLLEYMEAAKKSLRHALFTSGTVKPAAKVININAGRMKGIGGGRYINNHKTHTICRSGGKAMIYDGQSTRTMQLPGRYTITVTASAVDRDTYPVRLTPADGPIIMGFGVKQDVPTSVTSKANLMRTFELKDEVDQTFTFSAWIDKDHYPYFSFVNGSSKPITQVRANIRRRKIDTVAMKQPYRGPGIRISKFSIEGPFLDQWPPPSIETTYGMSAIPDLSDPKTRAEVVHRFAVRAFRRDVSTDEIVPYVRYLEAQAKETDLHEAVIRTFAAIMSSIDFLYIRESDGKLDSHALANRLSYFLWSTMPDEELFALAKADKLAEPTVLRQQVIRMLNDPRSNQFCDSFATQWLSLDKLGSMPPDVKSKDFRDYFRDNLEPAMLEETRRFFRFVFTKNKSVREFIDADYSFINSGLAKLYGIPFRADADQFQRVDFPAGSRRGGLLTHGSILTLTANGVETSPVERGVWVMSDFLGTPPPPPPKEVPAITPDLNGAETVRDLLEKHRSDSACMECHRRIDPLGFALEAYDPIGRFRTKYSKRQKVSTKGNYLGKDFADVDELKQILLNNLQPFARNLLVRMAEYAKGRELVAEDFITIESIMQSSEQEDFKLRDMLIMIATSDLMTNR